MSEPRELRKPVELGGDFGFTVGIQESRFAKEAWWRAYLPHQCDEWDITYVGTPAEAVAEMERFVAEAQQALEELRRRVAEETRT